MLANRLGVIMKYEKSCGAVVFDNGKVLIVKHRAGHSDFPKGHVEKNETEEETAIREVKEETNIDIQIIGCRNVVHYSPIKGVEKEVVFFAASKIGGELFPQLEEVSEARWVSVEEVVDYLTYDTACELFYKIRKEKEEIENEK